MNAAVLRYREASAGPLLVYRGVTVSGSAAVVNHGGGSRWPS